MNEFSDAKAINHLRITCMYLVNDHISGTVSRINEKIVLLQIQQKGTKIVKKYRQFTISDLTRSPGFATLGHISNTIHAFSFSSESCQLMDIGKMTISCYHLKN